MISTNQLLTFSPFPEDALDLGRGGGLRPVEELSMSLLLGRVELRERAEIGKIHPYLQNTFSILQFLVYVTTRAVSGYTGGKLIGYTRIRVEI